MIEQKDNDELTTAYLAGCYDTRKAYEQRLAAADSRIKELEQLNKRLAKFFQYGISCAFNGFDYDGESIHDDALALGLIVETDPPEGEEDGPWYKIATGVSDE